MRISTTQIYAAGLVGMEQNQSQVLKLQNRIASGRRILTPADDPVAAARVLEVTQTKDVAAEYARNQGDASNRLGMIDDQLTALTDLLQSVRSRTVQAANTVLSDSDRVAIATELQARLDEMLGIANSRSAEGDYLFSGYQGTAIPFVRTAASSTSTSSSVAYFGDDGERLLQVSPSQQLAANIAGSDLFMNVREGYGNFSTAAGGNGPGLPNQGTGMIDAGSLLDRQKWQGALNNDSLWQGSSQREVQIRFSSVAGVSSYQLFDASTNAPPAAPLAPRAIGPVQSFTPGQTIPVVNSTTTPPTDFGAQVVIDGSPVDGDTFIVKPSANKSMFQTVQEMLDLLRSPVDSGTARTAFSVQMQAHLNNLDQALANVGRVQATVGARLQVLDGLSSSSSALDVQYQQTLSGLQDLDYAQAISDFTRQQTSLEAAQKSFVQIAGLSLFKYL